MALYVGTNLINVSGSNSLNINNGSVDCLTVQTASGYNHVRVPSQVYFIAGYNGGTGWVGAGGARTYTDFNVVTQSTSAGFNTSNGAFYAPYDGYYFFTANTYDNKTNSGAGEYFHPMFLVNGSSGYRRPYGNTMYRMRGYGMAGGYTYDGTIEEIIYLGAGEYVQVYHSSTGAWQTYLPYIYFAGWFIG